MDVMRIIKPSVSIPNTNTLFHPSSIRPTKFKIGSLTVQQSGPLIYHTATTNRRLVPILAANYKQNPTSTSFQCCCSKEEIFVETVTGSDSGAWKQFVPNLQTQFIWMLFFRPIMGALSAISKLIPTWIYVSFILYVDKLKLCYGSKKKEPMNISFADLVGVDATIRKFQYMITILKGKRVDNRLLPAGIIFYGPPGAGKHTFVHALARETNVSFFPVYASDIKTGDVRIEKLFDEARACSPSIVYIRFVDSIARRQDCESNPALVQLLTEMEKCKDNGSVVIVMIAPDYPENLDPILLDSYMFLDEAHLSYPDEDGRRKIIGLYLKRVLREEDKEAICDIVASLTPGLNWRELKTFAVICYMYAASRGDVYVTMDDVFQALEKINNNAFSNLDKAMAQENMRRRVESIAFGSQK